MSGKARLNTMKGAVALSDGEARYARVGFASDDSGQFTERRSDSELGLTVEPEFVVPAAEVLDERVSGDDHLCG